KPAEEGQIVRRFLEGHGPRQIAGHENEIVGPDPLPPRPLDFRGVVFPAGTEHVHRFVLTSGQVEVADGKDSHDAAPHKATTRVRATRPAVSLRKMRGPRLTGSTPACRAASTSAGSHPPSRSEEHTSELQS